MRYLIPLCFCVYSKFFCTSYYLLFHMSSKITLFEITKINSTSESSLWVSLAPRTTTYFNKMVIKIVEISVKNSSKRFFKKLIEYNFK